MADLDDTGTFHSFVDLDEMQHSVVTHLNALYGSKINKLSESNNLLEELTITQNDLEERLKFATSEAPDRITHAVCSAEAALKKNKELQREFMKLECEIKDCLEKFSDIVNVLSPHLLICRREQDTKAYLQWSKSITEISNQLESHLKNGDHSFALATFLRLRESSVVILDSDCENLRDFTVNMLKHWHQMLTNTFKFELEASLKSLHWPFTSPTPPPQPYPTDLIQKMQMMFEGLIQLQVPTKVLLRYPDLLNKEEQSSVLPTLSILDDFKVNFPSLQVMIRPLEVRFLYHFFGNKSTNSLSHPEWFLTQILRWLRVHESFLDEHVQMVLNKNGDSRLAKTEFSRALLCLVVMKLNEDLPNCLEDSKLFCHTVQETLEFVRDLPAWVGGRHKLTTVLTQPKIFNTWIQVERKYALELMDEFVCSSSAWQPSEPSSLPQCGQQLILMLQGITDRYRNLTQPGHRLQFLDLQLDLLDDFRVRLLQLSRPGLSEPLDSNYIPILNTVQHIARIMEEWSDSPFFLELHYFREKLCQPEPYNIAVDGLANSLDMLDINSDSKTQNSVLTKDSSPFSHLLGLYDHIKSEMLLSLCLHCLSEVRARTMPFRHEKWFSPQKRLAEGDITPSLCPLLDVLLKMMRQLRNALQESLFQELCVSMGRDLDKFFFEEVVLENSFSDCGGQQFNHDITKGVLPIFGDLTHRPEILFPLINDSCLLLSMPLAMVLLLQETLSCDLEGNLPLSNGDAIVSMGVSPVKALEEAGIANLSVEQARRVIAARILSSSL